MAALTSLKSGLDCASGTSVLSITTAAVHFRKAALALEDLRSALEHGMSEKVLRDRWAALKPFNRPVPPELDRYLVYKGSIAIDGISLTIAELRGDILAVTVIPHTYRNTTLGTRKPGDLLNIECDMLAKHVEKLLGRVEVKPGLTIEKLKEMGF